MEREIQSELEKFWGKTKYEHLCRIAGEAKASDFFADSIISVNNKKHNEDGWLRAYRDKLWFLKEFPDGKPLNSNDVREVSEKNAWEKYNKLLKTKSSSELDFSTIKSNEKKRIIRWQSYYFHDEPWMTLFALYGLSIGFRIGKSKVIRDLFQTAIAFKSQDETPDFPVIPENVQIRLEASIPSNPLFQQELFNKYKTGFHHPYFDVRNEFQLKASQTRKWKLEGSTSIDGLMTWSNFNGRNAIFIEAKYMSDISNHITYSPSRNQIARIIDSILHRMLVQREGVDLSQINSFWFFLLTPEAFKSKQYGGKSLDGDSLNAIHGRTRPRFYNYIMEDYLNWENLCQDLPHWNKYLSTTDWQNICNRIGWISWEDIVRTVIQHKTMTEPAIEWFAEFFFERGINPQFDDAEAGLSFMMNSDPEFKTLVKELGDLVKNNE